MHPHNVLVTVTGYDRPGVTSALFAALAAHDVEVLDVEQVVIRGRLVLGVALALRGDPGPLRRAATLAAEALGTEIEVTITEDTCEPAEPPRARHHVIVLGRPLRAGALGEIARRIADLGGNVDAISRLSDDRFVGLELMVSGADHRGLAATLVTVARETGTDIAVERAELRRRSKRLVLLDADRTLIPTDTLGLLAELAGCGAESARLLAAAREAEAAAQPGAAGVSRADGVRAGGGTLGSARNGGPDRSGPGSPARPGRAVDGVRPDGVRPDHRPATGRSVGAPGLLGASDDPATGAPGDPAAGGPAGPGGPGGHGGLGGSGVPTGSGDSGGPSGQGGVGRLGRPGGPAGGGASGRAASAGRSGPGAAPGQPSREAELLRARVALLAGLPVSALQEVRAGLRWAAGADELVGTLKRMGYRCGAVSAGAAQVVEPLLDGLGLDFAVANRLEVVGRRLTGRLVDAGLDPFSKAQALARFAEAYGVPLSQTVAVGGAGGTDMVTRAGLGVAVGTEPTPAGAGGSGDGTLTCAESLLTVLGLRGPSAAVDGARPAG
jgi:phosphoserine phosphatase/predicted amino acid-binding ACT domain protein